MGYAEGWAALNLEMPKKVPRTEYSATSHWDLLTAVTGIAVDEHSDHETRNKAARAFMQAWDYSLIWSVMVGRNYLQSGRTTSMGHAEYAAAGVDFNANVHCPFSSPEEALALDPMAEYGTIDKREISRAFDEHYAANCRNYSDAVNMSGVYITMFSGLIDIFGWEMLLLAGGTDPVGFGRLAQRYETWITQFFEAFADSRAPVLMAHDDIVWTSGAVFRPAWYREYIFPAYKRMWRPVLDAGKKIIYTSDGNYTEFLPDIVDAGAHALVMEPTTDMAAFAETYGRTHGFIGNADTRILLRGDKAEIRAEVERCMRIGKACPGFMMAVGNHIPPNTPVENAVYYNEVYEELAYR